MFRAVVPYILFAYVSLVGLTTRLQVVRGEVKERLNARNQRFLYAFWHQRQVYFTWTHRGEKAAILVSRSKDGEMIAQTMRLSRIEAVRGSSSKGAAAAVLALIKAAQDGFDIGITPDGPKGPAREVKEGAIFLAQRLGIPIVPIANALTHRIAVNRAWDGFHIPLPFGRAVVVYGEPITVGPQDDLAAKAAELKKAMDCVTDEADEMAV